MLLLRRARTLWFIVCLTVGLPVFANPDADDDDYEYREAFTDGICPLPAIAAVEAADARQRFEDFERELMRAGLLGKDFKNFGAVENQIGAHTFSLGLSAFQTLFQYLARGILKNSEGPLSGHDMITIMREYFGKPLPNNLLFPSLQEIGIDSSLRWGDSRTYFEEGFGYLEKREGAGSGLIKRRDGSITAVARIEGELFFYLYQPTYVGPRKGRLGVFEWRTPHRPVGRPEHVAVLVKYFQDQRLKLTP